MARLKMKLWWLAFVGAAAVKFKVLLKSQVGVSMTLTCGFRIELTSPRPTGHANTRPVMTFWKDSGAMSWHPVDPRRFHLQPDGREAVQPHLHRNRREASQ